MSQKDDILAHLRGFGGITALEALRSYGCLRLAARIGELRKTHRITKTDIVDGRKRYALYRLEEE